VASIKGPETVSAEQRIDLDRMGQWDPLLAQSNELKRLINDLAGQSMVIRWSYPVYWGYVLTSPSHHVLVLRGTQRGYEWFQTLRANQVEAKDVSGLSFTGSIHEGFSTIYSHLSGAVIKAARTLDPARPLYVAGHSLGSPLASLAALDIAQKIPTLRHNLRLYTYAGPRLGNPAFAEAFSRLLPNSYRIVNLADLVPSLPPTKTGDVVYVHFGEPWGFTMASGDIGPNHFISAYRSAIDQEQEQPLLRMGMQPQRPTTFHAAP
jgi:predicted lipase